MHIVLFWEGCDFPYKRHADSLDALLMRSGNFAMFAGITSVPDDTIPGGDTILKKGASGETDAVRSMTSLFAEGTASGESSTFFDVIAKAGSIQD